MANPPSRLYRAVWSFLLARCPAGDSLQLTAKKFLSEMEDNGFLSERTVESQINTVLNILEKNRLIKRTESKPGKTFNITPQRFFDRMSEFTKPKDKAVIDVLAKMIREHSAETGDPDREVVRLVTTAEKLAELAEVSDYAVSKALKALKDADMVEVEKQYTGKITEVIKRPKTLDGTFDFEALEHKRQAAYRRLEIMVEYTELPASQRMQYIRDYFLKKRFEDDAL